MTGKITIGKIILGAAALCVMIGSFVVVGYVKSLFKGPDYAELPSCYPFKSAAKEKQYREYYEDRMKEWPMPSETRIIVTSYGRTAVRLSGRESAPPLVLLPSGFASSLIWLPNIEGLAPFFRIYAVDNIYDVGLSVNSRPVTTGEDLTAWLDELLTELGLDDGVTLMGLSFGGWLTSRYALVRQGRLRSAVLAAPVATLFPLPGEWAWRGIVGALPPHRFFMTHFLINWMCPNLANAKDEYKKRLLDHWMNDALMAMKCFTFRMPITPTVLTDEELRSLQIPILFLVGENEVIYPAAQAVDRLKTVAPWIVTKIIPDAGHDLTIAQTELVNSTILTFLQGIGIDSRKGYNAVR
ncbi:MAG: alpha/beta hydrolase [Calditrichaeota bacterium]|nr:MAG: alpha/beta hydrolase [Calditrichota bacterium]